MTCFVVQSTAPSAPTRKETTLPPGRYLLAAVTDIDRDEQFDPAFLAGNVVERPLSAVFADSPVLAAFRDLEVESCRSCDRFSACHGGCPAIGYFLTHSIGSPDPECLRSTALEVA